MKLLLDANLSWRLTNRLKLHFEDCLHVDSIGLPVPSKDIEIWDYAFTHNLIIVTNDEDFLNFASQKSRNPCQKTKCRCTKWVIHLVKKMGKEVCTLLAKCTY